MTFYMKNILFKKPNIVRQNEKIILTTETGEEATIKDACPNSEKNVVVEN